MAGRQDTTEIPRWAKELGNETWEKINERLDEGFDTMDIVRELEIPQSKIRSLQAYARKFGPRRRLNTFAKFKDALLTGAINLGPDFARAMTFVAANAVNPDVKPSTQHKACSLMVKFAETIGKMMAGDEAAERQRSDQEATAQMGNKREELSREAIEQIKTIYGLGGGGDGDGGK